MYEIRNGTSAGRAQNRSSVLSVHGPKTFTATFATPGFFTFVRYLLFIYFIFYYYKTCFILIYITFLHL